MTETNIDIPRVCVGSEVGRLRAVLLHKPGVEITRMTPQNAAEALYSDILNKPIVDREYSDFCGVLEKWTRVFYVEDVLASVLENQNVRKSLVEESCRLDGCESLSSELIVHPSRQLAKELIEGVERKGWTPDSDNRYALKPLYNLFFTRDASSSVYDRVLINSMSFPVRRREILIYKAVFENYFGCETFNAEQHDSEARTEGGDVQIARQDMLCIGEGIRTNRKGIEYLAKEMGEKHGKFSILVQQLPHTPESFIHLDMVFTFLSRHECMAFEPMLRKTGVFSGKETTLISIDGGKTTYTHFDNILDGLKATGWDMKPVLCGGSDAWTQQREQWHSGANFFALGEGKVLGYSRNNGTIEALDKAGFAILKASDICSGKVDMNSYDKFVAAFDACELPRGGGGARCMTMPVNRDLVVSGQ
jgi:arginine deiminase